MAGWRHPRANQGKSGLLALPAELRVKILRELLVADEPVGVRQLTGRTTSITVPAGLDANGQTIYNTTTTPETGFGISPAILRTCQQLNHEGEFEMYAGNTLRIDVTAGNYAGAKLTAHQVCARNDPNCTSCLQATTMDDYSLASKTCAGHYRPWQWTLALLNVVDQFKRIRITLRAAGNLYTRLALREFLNEFEPYLVDKHVEVDVFFPTAANDPDFIKYVHTFRLLRCRSFKFVHADTTDPVHAQVEREVVSKLPVADLVSANDDLFQLGRILGFEMQMQHRHDVVAEVRELLGYAQQAMETFDVNAFRVISRAVTDMWDAEVDSLRQNADATDAKLEKLQGERGN